MIYGIDLGTTQSCVARINRFGFPDVLASREGPSTTPSVVYYDHENLPTVGEPAKGFFGARPERTVMCIKRSMPSDNYRRSIGEMNLDPVEVSSHILRKLVDDASAKMRDEEARPPVSKVVITVPAYFGDLARRRTKEAGERIGLEVVGLLSEPEAAALSYFSTRLKEMENKIILIYDLGGGTFDAGIVKVRNGRVETLGFGGDSLLGGFDWDKALAELALYMVSSDVEIPSDPANFTAEIGKLMLEAESCKKALSSSRSFEFSFHYNQGLHTVTITRDDFESCTVDLMDRTLSQIREAARKADARNGKPADEPRILNPDNSLTVDDVVLVGGSSRMPMVAAMIRNNLRMEPKIIDPDLAVAKGAAIYAGILKDRPTAGIKELKSRGTRSYGLGIIHDRIANLIKTNENMIIENRRFDGKYVTSEDNDMVAIKIFENESDADYIERGSRTPLRDCTIYFGEIKRKGTPVDIFLSRDASGIVSLSAECVGKKLQIEFGTV